MCKYAQAYPMHGGTDGFHVDCIVSWPPGVLVVAGRDCCRGRAGGRQCLLGAVRERCTCGGCGAHCAPDASDAELKPHSKIIFY